jgi:LAO/AO transport system kinase
VTDPAEDAVSLIEGIRSGDRRSLARAITFAESTRPEHRVIADAVLEAVLPSTGNAVRVGISGPPGVGKSTFIEAIGNHIISQGLRLAVLAVDPSSRLTGGSILGDKTRMGELANQPNAFIRPSPGGTQLGGVARRTREAMLLCEAAGFDVVIVETIGVGQSEVAVSDMVDLFALLVSPGGGDELQGIKRGIMELADLVIVNKADGDLAAAAARTRGDYASAVHLLRPKWNTWATEVLACSALNGVGVSEVWDAVMLFRSTVTANGELLEARSAQATAWLWSEIGDTLLERFRADLHVAGLLPEIESAVSGGRVTPAKAALQLLQAFGTTETD